MMKTSTVTQAILAAAVMTASAGTDVIAPRPPATHPDAFSGVRRPISNPTLFDLALPQTGVHVIYMHHRFPDQYRLANGANVGMGGDLNLAALALEYAFNERLSVVALKDGYVDFNPNATFTPEEGFANVAAGLKYAFIYNPESQYVMSASAVIELPVGSKKVFQGEGDGAVNLSLQNLKVLNQWQFASSLGVQVPFDSGFSTQGWASAHVSYEVNRYFIPTLELNYFRVLEEGDGGSRFQQLSGAVPSLAGSEGADLLNFGASGSGDTSYATIALGFRSRLTDALSMGVAYEMPLTSEEKNITKDRITVDMTYTF